MTLGRPSIFSQELAQRICDRLAAGETLRSVCRDEDMPVRTTIYRWLENDPAFKDQYASARDHGLEVMADELFEICDDSTNDYMERLDEKGQPTGTYVANTEHINRSRLRVDTRKWYLSKLAPKRYGEMMRHAGEDGGPLRIMIEDFLKNA